MNREPYRGPQGANRGVARPTSAQPEPQPAKEPVAHRAPAAHSKKDKQSRGVLVKVLIAVVVLVIIAAAAWFGWTKMQGGATGIDSSKYQAVFFTNGQVYFGKLTSANDDYLKLTDVFYLQTQNSDSDAKDSKNPQESSTDQSEVQLIKLGNEVHGPEDAMMITRDQVLFYENLKSDGKVAQTIAQYKQQ